MIRIFQPTLGQDELQAVGKVFADQWPGNGPRVKAFERAFAEYVGAAAEEMIAVTSCTEGLFQSIEALDLTDEDEVILPTISFIGAAHAVCASGAKLRLIDVDPRTLNPLTDDIDRAITSKTRAILLLHFGGRLDWIDEIKELAKRRNVVLIEDTACALGGRHSGTSYGTFGDIGVWSFDSMKLLVTGDGGMIRISDKEMRTRVYNKVHLGGVRPGAESAASNSERWWEVEPVCWGRLSFMNDLAAAIGQVQLARLEQFIHRRKSIAHAYDSAFASTSWLQLPPPPKSGETVPYFYWIQTQPTIRDTLARYLREREIYTTFRYWPLHRTQLYRNAESYPGADLAADTTLLLPVHQNLSESDVNRIIETVNAFMP